MTSKTYTDLQKREFLILVKALERRGARITTDNDNSTVIAIYNGKTVAQWFANSGYIEGDAHALAMAGRIDEDKKIKRAEVYAAIDSERNYQDQVWRENAGFDPDSPVRTVAEELLMLEEYVAKARAAWTAAPRNTEVAITTDILRKCAGICVRAMENHGAPIRNK